MSPISTIAILLNRQDLQLILDAVRAVSVVLSIYVPYALGWSGLVAVGCYSLSMALLYGAYYVVYKWLVERSRTASPGAVAALN